MKKKITLQAMINKIIKARGKDNQCIGFEYEGRVYLSDNICQITGYSIHEEAYDAKLLASLGLMWWEDKRGEELIKDALNNHNVFEYKNGFPAKVFSDGTYIALEGSRNTTYINKKYLDVLGEDYNKYTYKYNSISLSVFKDGVLEGYIMGVNIKEV